MATFAAQPQDENLVPGWNSQGNFPSVATVGKPGVGYAVAGVTGAVTTQAQSLSGFPFPPGAMNIGAENSAAYTTQILQNGSYTVAQNLAPAGTNPTAVGAVITTTAALTGVVLSGMSLLVQTHTSTTITYTIAGGSAVTVVAGGIIPAGAAVTTLVSGDVFVTVGA